ncbi:MAG: hypothetical protein IPG62_00310 [Sphingomonadales bacterium]|nr:hypothetical protein [Sphingomonadales bacterium]
MHALLALSGKKVAIMTPICGAVPVTQTLAPQAAEGWVEVVGGSAQLKDILIVDNRRDPCSGGDQRTSGLAFTGSAFDELIETLRHCPRRHRRRCSLPVLAVDDTRVLLKHLDTLAMLARWRQTPVKAITPLAASGTDRRIRIWRRNDHGPTSRTRHGPAMAIPPTVMAT